MQLPSQIEETEDFYFNPYIQFSIDLNQKIEIKRVCSNMQKLYHFNSGKVFLYLPHYINHRIIERWYKTVELSLIKMTNHICMGGNSYRLSPHGKEELKKIYNSLIRRFPECAGWWQTEKFEKDPTQTSLDDVS